MNGKFPKGFSCEQCLIRIVMLFNHMFRIFDDESVYTLYANPLHRIRSMLSPVLKE